MQNSNPFEGLSHPYLNPAVNLSLTGKEVKIILIYIISTSMDLAHNSLFHSAKSLTCHHAKPDYPYFFLCLYTKKLKFLLFLCGTRQGHSIKKPITILFCSQSHKQANILRHCTEENYKYCEALCTEERRNERKEPALLDISTGVTVTYLSDWAAASTRAWDASHLLLALSVANRRED